MCPPLPARDRACSRWCTRLVPAACCLFSKRTTRNAARNRIAPVNGRGANVITPIRRFMWRTSRFFRSLKRRHVSTRADRWLLPIELI
jgi:hypothetical protein